MARILFVLDILRLLSPAMSKRLLSPFELLFHKHELELLAFASQRGGHEAAEDLVQDAYLRLLQHENPTIIANPRAYLYKVTANVTIDHIRKQQVRDKLAVHVEDFDELHSGLPETETVTENTLLLQRCVAALETLPELQRHIFLLHKVEGMSHAEISKTLNISTKTVERHCAKAFAACFKLTGQGEA